MIRFFYFLLRCFKGNLASCIVNKLANIVMPIYYSLTITPNISVNNKGIIVSFTSFPRRIGKVHLVIESILRQKVKPSKILLYLSRKQFGTTIENSNLPTKLLKLQSKGLEIIMVDGDLRSYKKFHYAFRDYSNQMVLTIDDDVIYNSDLIERLVEKKTESNAVANLTRVINRSTEGKPLPYSSWTVDRDSGKNHIVIGVGGVLYSPKRLYKDVLESDLYVSLAPKADDLWLSAMCILNGVEITPTDYPNKWIAIRFTDNVTLFSENVYDNDIQIHAINDYYDRTIGRHPF